MKIRNGFVSNSSSSSYILDLRKEGVQKIIKIANSQWFQRPYGCDRNSAMTIGEDVVRYAEEWLEDLGDYGYEKKEDPNNYGNWILNCAKELGTENTVFIRISDEEDVTVNIPNELIYSEREYH